MQVEVNSPMSSSYSCLLLGASGNVGRAALDALIQSERCARITTIGRRHLDDVVDDKVTQIVLDMTADDFEAKCEEAARGHDYAISCHGVGHGTTRMTEAEFIAIEVTMVEQFARGCKKAGVEKFAFLSVTSADESSRMQYIRVMGKKDQAIKSVGFEHLGIMHPGVIVGNKNTPAFVGWLSKFIPGRNGGIDKDVLGRSFVGYIESKRDEGVEILYNADLRELGAK